MEESLKNFIKICIDFVLLVFVGAWILVLLFVKPYKRGFFCNDQSIMHPYHPDTVTMAMLVPIGVCIPLIVIIVIELFRGKMNLDGDRELKVFSWSVPNSVQNLYRYIGLFLFGAACCQLSTDLGKMTIGRLRPHFINVCQPMMNDGTDCTDSINLNRYIQNYSCRGSQATDKMLNDMRLSFPSGHASFAFFTMVFTALYLQSRLNWRGSKLLKHVLQFLFIIAALYTALSRISDYKHHWSDVLAGSILGITVAILTALVGNFFNRNHSGNERLPIRRSENMKMDGSQ